MRIAVGQVEYLYHLFPAGMRVFPTGTGPVVVYAAMVVLKKERARRGDYDIIAVLIDTKVFFDERCRSHSESSRQPLDIALVEYGARCLAAVGTLQAIGSGKDLVVKTVYCGIEPARVRALKRLQKLLVLFILACGQQGVTL